MLSERLEREHAVSATLPARSPRAAVADRRVPAEMVVRRCRMLSPFSTTVPAAAL